MALGKRCSHLVLLKRELWIKNNNKHLIACDMCVNRGSKPPNFPLQGNGRANAPYMFFDFCFSKKMAGLTPPYDFRI
jgi:hypothetical protein